MRPGDSSFVHSVAPTECISATHAYDHKRVVRCVPGGQWVFPIWLRNETRIGLDDPASINLFRARGVRHRKYGTVSSNRPKSPSVNSTDARCKPNTAADVCPVVAGSKMSGTRALFATEAS